VLNFFKRFWTGETNGLTAAAFIVGAASLTSRLVGVVRDRVLASTFGAGADLDAYYAAFRLPDLLYNLIILGALSAGFIPVFSEYLERRGLGEAKRLAGQVLGIVGVVMAVLSLLLSLFAAAIVPFLTPGFSPESVELTVQLSRIMALSPFFLGLSAVMGGVLQAMRRFAAFALAPVLYNLGIILGAVWLAPTMGIHGVAWGVVIGAILHFVVQTMVAVPIGVGAVQADLRSEGLRRILMLMLPRTAGLAVAQVNVVIVLMLASRLPEGSVTVFTLANNLQSFPIGIVGISFAIAAFPLLSRAVSREDDEAFQHALGGAGRKIVFLLLPATAIFLLMRAQIVRLILGQGSFNWSDTIRTADTLGLLALSLVAQSLVPLLARAYYALQDTRTPLVVGIVAEIINLALAVVLLRPFGLLGLAAAFSVAAFVQVVLLWVLLRKRKGPLGQGTFTQSAWKALMATIAFCVVAFPIREWLGTIYPLTTFWQVALQFSAPTLVGLLVFLFIARVMKSPELDELYEAAAKRLWRKAKVSEGVDEAVRSQA
jgi:putative peptidoglycan lipid II flippase